MEYFQLTDWQRYYCFRDPRTNLLQHGSLRRPHLRISRPRRLVYHRDERLHHHGMPAAPESHGITLHARRGQEGAQEHPQLRHQQVRQVKGHVRLLGLQVVHAEQEEQQRPGARARRRRDRAHAAEQQLEPPLGRGPRARRAQDGDEHAERRHVAPGPISDCECQELAGCVRFGASAWDSERRPDYRDDGGEADEGLKSLTSRRPLKFNFTFCRYIFDNLRYHVVRTKSILFKLSYDEW